jgi:hypothetical protein
VVPGITPSPLHWVHRGGVPNIDPAQHRVLIHGMVDRPVILTLDEIKRLPSVSRIYFLECGGNTLMEWGAPTAPTVQITHGMTSCSEWTGVPLSVLLREVGVQTGASWVLAEGADATGNERSLPMAKAMDDILVAYGQNGEALRPENGYPLRLIVPGWEAPALVAAPATVTDRPHDRNESVDHTRLPMAAQRFAFVMEAIGHHAPRAAPLAGARSTGDGLPDGRGSFAASVSRLTRARRPAPGDAPAAGAPFRARGSDSRGGGTGGKRAPARRTDETGYVSHPDCPRQGPRRQLSSTTTPSGLEGDGDGSVHNVIRRKLAVTSTARPGVTAVSVCSAS